MTPSTSLVLFLNDIATFESHVRSERVKAVLDGAQLQLDGNDDEKADASPSTIEVAGSAGAPVGLRLNASRLTVSTGIGIHASAANVTIDDELRNSSEFERHKELALTLGGVLLGLIAAVGLEFTGAWIRGRGE